MSTPADLGQAEGTPDLISSGSAQEGQKPPLGCYLVVVDDTPESEFALRFACRRSVQLGARISLLRVIEPIEAQVWLATEDLVREERVAEAEAAMEAAADRVMKVTGQMATLIVREGKTLDVLKDLNDEEGFDIMSLVLASGSPDSPGTLISRVPQFAPRMNFVTVIIPFTPPIQESEEAVNEALAEDIPE